MAENGSSSVPADGYLDWAQEELGVIVHHPLRVSSTPGKDERGVFCEEDIPAESIVVSVPWEVGFDNIHSIQIQTPVHHLMSLLASFLRRTSVMSTCAFCTNPTDWCTFTRAAWRAH